MTTFLVCVIVATLFGGTTWFRGLMAGIAATLGLLVFLAGFLFFGWWAVAVPATVLGLGLALGFAQDKEREMAARNAAERMPQDTKPRYRSLVKPDGTVEREYR